MCSQSRSAHGVSFARLSTGASLLLAGAAVTVLALSTQADAAEKGPIKIGVLLPMTGNFAPNGQDTLAGIQIYLDSIGNEVAGRKIELIVEDAQGKPSTGLTKARKLVESDKVAVVTGLVSSGVALAVNGYMRGTKVPLVVSGDAGANELTMPGKLHSDTLVRLSQTGRTPGATAADWGRKQGWRKISLIVSDYAGGIETGGSFARLFCKEGGQIAQAQFPPIGTNDYGPFLTNIDRSVDALVDFIPGADGLRFGRQYLATGLMQKFPIMDVYGQVTYDPFLSQFGNGAVGMLSTLHYTWALNTPLNDKFVKAFEAKLHRKPGDNGPDGWAGARAIADAAKAVNGDVENSQKFMNALMHVKFESPKGPISLDKYGNVIQSMYVRKVEKAGGALENAVVATYPNQDQFWPFTEKEYESFKYPLHDLKAGMTDCARNLAKK